MNDCITLVDYAEPDTYKDSKTEFVVFVKDGQRFSPSVYNDLFQVYKNNPLFRKLSMVSPVLTTPMSQVYGWTFVATDMIHPKYTPSSIEPYAIQMGPVTGSVIRRSALDRINYEFTGNVFNDSIGLSLALWESGQVVYIAPMTWERGDNSLDMSHAATVTPELQKLFKREMIG